jgi:hypothetical protein
MIKLWYLLESKLDPKNYKGQLYQSTKLLLQIFDDIILYMNKVLAIMLLIFDLDLLYNSK